MNRPWLPLVLTSIALALVLAQTPFFRVSSVPHDAPANPVPLDGSLDPLGTAALTPIFVDGPEARERIASEGDLVRLYPDVVFRFGSSSRPLVALTFDDGPDDVYTPRILDVLRRYGAPATFFVVGAMVERHLPVAERIVAEGHELGHHGYRHVDFTRLSDGEIREQLARTAALLDVRLGRRPVTFRPPYSALNPRAVEVIAEADYKIVLWNIDSLDWRGLKSSDILANVVPHLGPGAVVLMHSAGGDLSGTVEALPLLLEMIADRGLQPVTVSELFADRWGDPPPSPDPQPQQPLDPSADGEPSRRQR